MKEFGDQGAESERVETWRAKRECRVQKGITELHRTLDSAVSFAPGEEVPHLSSGAAHGRATCITVTSGTAEQAELRLESVRKGQMGLAGATDFGPGVERFCGPCAKGK